MNNITYFQHSLIDPTMRNKNGNNRKLQTLGERKFEKVNHDMKSITASLSNGFTVDKQETLTKSTIIKEEQQLIHSLRRELHRKEKIISK